MTLLKTLLLSLLLVPALVQAQDCNDKFKDSYVPVVKYDQEVCYNKFAVLFNYQYKIPMISAEYLTPDDIRGAKDLKRKDAFHVDSTIPSKYNQTIASYKNTGFDKGHMTPNGDAGTQDNQYQTFSLANMTPQTKKLNQVVWRSFEEKVRSDVLQFGPAYVVTGSVVRTGTNRMNGIVIPDYIFKGVYFTRTQKSVVYVGKNDDSMQSEVLSTEDFQKKYGIQIFK